MGTSNSKSKNSDSEQVSQTEAPNLEEVFPIETFLQNPGYQLISRNIFKYLKLKDFSNCCLVSKGWKRFIDEDKFLAKVQLTKAYLLENAMKFNLNINQSDDYQANVFHSACGFGTEETVKLLIQNAKKYNIDLNLRDDFGFTPFHYACYYGQLQIVEILLKNSKQHKINVVSLNNAGKDGQALAKQRGHTDVVKLIKDWKKKQSNEVTSQIHNELQFQLERIQQSGDTRASHLIKLVKELKEITN